MTFNELLSAVSLHRLLDTKPPIERRNDDVGIPFDKYVASFNVVDTTHKLQSKKAL